MLTPKLLTTLQRYSWAQFRSDCVAGIVEDVFGNIDDALNHARRLLGLAEVSRPSFSHPTVKREM